MYELQIVYLSPKDLTPYEHNARKHTEHDLSVIEKSIRENGFNDPIGIWGENNLIVEGHGRQLAALSIGLDVVPCIRLDHLTDAQRREYALVHNKSAELSEWDFTELEAQLAELSLDFDMTDFGFDDIQGGVSEAQESEDTKEVSLQEQFQLIVDCEDEADMQQKYDVLQEAGIECRVSTL